MSEYASLTVQYLGGPLKISFSYDPTATEDNRMTGPGGGTGRLSKPEKEFFRAMLVGALESMDSAEKMERKVTKEMRA